MNAGVGKNTYSYADTHAQTQSWLCDSNTHTQTDVCTHALINTQSSVSSPSWPIRRSGLWSLPLDSLALFWQLVTNTKGWGGSKSRGRVKVDICVSVRVLVCVKIACVLLGDSDFKNRTPCCAAITFKGRRDAQRALFFSCLWSSYCRVLLEKMH